MHSSLKFYLTKRSNGFYYIGYFEDESLHWKSTRTRRKSEALKILRESKTMLAPKRNPELLSNV